MAEYAKKLHIRKSGVVTDIKLYSTTGEVGADYLTLKDDINTMYAKAGTTNDANASDLTVKKGSTTYAVLTQATPPYTKVTYSNVGTSTFTVPAGVTKLQITVAGSGGGGGGYIVFTAANYYNRLGGTGGRGGLTTQTVTVTSGQQFSVTVGAGGNAGGSVSTSYRNYEAYSYSGSSGGNSVFGSIISSGGGGGGRCYAYCYDEGGTGGSDGSNGTSYGTGGTGGSGGIYPTGAQKGANGWVYVEYGVGIE